LAIYKDVTHLPARLWIVRHGESAGNVARDKALREGAPRIALESRDVDVPLSSLGEHQSDALGKWFANASAKPQVIIASPYRRARDTAIRVMQAGGVEDRSRDLVSDERLREKEFGILDGLTRTGIESVYPDQASFRTLLGKFYHRPPGGESWCDVILRLRSVLDTLSLHFAGKRVLIVTHQVVVLCLRYLLEGLDERAILEIDAAGDIANCAVTEYGRSSSPDGKSAFALVRYNNLAPLTDEGTPVTAAPDTKAAAP